MEHKTVKYEKALRRYLPEEFIPYVAGLMIRYPVHFRITKPRNSKLGDFRANRSGTHQISVNGNLNQYSFLITTLHEFAHLITYQEFGWKVRPHGEEWKMAYSRLLTPVIDSKQLPEELHTVLLRSLRNIKASSCTDKHLSRELQKYDQHEEDLISLEKLDKNDIFELNGKTFTKGNLRRTRYVCWENHTQRSYLVSSLALVKKIKHEE